MNDRHLFRGKRLDDVKWLEGNVIFGAIYMEGQRVHIVNPGTVGIQAYPTGKLNQIDSATLGQCTGLKDKNGRLIFESDIVAADYEWGVVVWGSRREADGRKAPVTDSWQIDWITQIGKKMLIEDLGFWIAKGCLEIIGNAHDNPALLEGAGA